MSESEVQECPNCHADMVRDTTDVGVCSVPHPWACCECGWHEPDIDLFDDDGEECRHCDGTGDDLDMSGEGFCSYCNGRGFTQSEESKP